VSGQAADRDLCSDAAKLVVEVPVPTIPGIGRIVSPPSVKSIDKREIMVDISNP